MSAPGSSSAPPASTDRLRAALRDHPLALSVAAVVVLAVLATTAFTPHYETNDDACMQLIASGMVFDSTPDEHLMYSNVLIGLPLQFLYRKAPDVPWYALHQIATLALSAIAVCYALLRVNPTARQAAVVLLFLVLAVLPCLVDLQFTKTAFLASFAGILLLLAPLRGATPWPRIADVAGCALVVWGSLIRYESLILAGLIAVPVALAAAYVAPRRAAWRAIPLGTSFGLAVALNLLNASYYAHSPGWEEFYAYNAVRAQFTDYGYFTYSGAKGKGYREAGWDGVDLTMLTNWFFADRDRYSLEKMRRIAASAPRTTVRSFWVKTNEVLHGLPNFPALIGLMVGCICGPFLTGSGWRRFALPATLFAAAFGLMIVLAVYFWLPPRVAFGLFMGALAGSALRREDQDAPNDWKSAGKERQSSSTKDLGIHEIMRRGAIVFAAVLLTWSLWKMSEADAAERRLHSGMLGVMQTLKPRRDQLFVLWREWFPIENLVHPLESTRGLRDFRCLWLSAQLPTPITDRRLAEFHIDDIYLAICERPDVFLVAMEGLVKEVYQEYVKKHYNLATAYAVIFPTRTTPPLFVGVAQPPGFVVYRLKKTGEIAPKGNAPVQRH
jgi:hypothetical protein